MELSPLNPQFLLLLSRIDEGCDCPRQEVIVPAFFLIDELSRHALSVDRFHVDSSVLWSRQE